MKANRPKYFSKIAKPEKSEPSLTDAINSDDTLIKERLKNYEETPIDKITPSTHVRYFIFDKKQEKYLFRLGGILQRKEKDYAVLSNGDLSWTVSYNITHNDTTHPTQFWKVLNKSQIKSKDSESKLSELEKQNLELRKMIEDLKNAIPTPIPQEPPTIQEKPKRKRQPKATPPEQTTPTQEQATQPQELKPKKPRKKQIQELSTL